jgi:predicted metal-dependent HD superfamily phosphohydrolase
MAKPSLFHTGAGVRLWESTARANVEAEVRGLRQV